LRVPDLTVGTSWDQRGGAFNNQVNVTLALPLPLWNKNQGNIKYAEAMAAQSKVGLKGEEVRITSEVAASFKKWNEAKLNFGQFSQSNMDTYDMIYNSMLINFKKGNINILEFTDFIESFSQMKLQNTTLKKNLVLSVEGLNNAVNKELF
jgi:cobalt-zinc-cadmium efflux system outer membrane protein